MYQSLDDQALLVALEQSGAAPHPALIAECLARQESLTPALLQLFQESLDDAWEADDDPRWHRLRHAGKLLIAYREPAALPIFADLFTRPDDALDVLEWFETDLAQYGATAVATLLHITNLDTAGAYHYGRALACGTLSLIARQNPETGTEIITALRAKLPTLRADGSPDVPPDFFDFHWTDVLIALGELGDSASQPQIEALFHHDLVDDAMIALDHYHDLLAGEELPELDSFDIIQEYARLYEFEQNQRGVAARAQLLRDQGFRPPVLPTAPIQSGAADWFNEKLLGKPAKTQKIGRNE
jgi:hypothetical protein